MSKTVRVRAFFAVIALLLGILFLGCLLRFSFREFYRTAYPVHYREAVLAESAERGLEPAFVFAVIHCESGFNPEAVSYVDARGLMQITEQTFEWVRGRLGDDESFHYDELFIPEVNIRYGSALLRLLLDEFGGEREALAAYHAGWGSVKRWLDDEKYSSDGERLAGIPSRVTGGYVEKVLAVREFYLRLYDF